MVAANTWVRRIHVSAMYQRGPTSSFTRRRSSHALLSQSISVVAPRDHITPSRARQVIIHNHRDKSFLKQVSAGGTFLALMSSSVLTYALVWGLGPFVCSMIVLQTGSAAVGLAVYLRTYVARAVLYPQNSQLGIVGCGYFGIPLRTEHRLPLSTIHPHATTTTRFIKFRLRGPTWHPKCWIRFRIPRFGVGGGSVSGGNTQIGARPLVKSWDSLAKPAEQLSARDSSFISRNTESVVAPLSIRQFPGAGLGDKEEDHAFKRIETFKRVHSGSKAKAVHAPQKAEKSLATIKMQGGLPLDAREEEKIIDFFSDPAAYALS